MQRHGAADASRLASPAVPAATTTRVSWVSSNPSRSVALAFAVAIAVATLLLRLPAARDDGRETTLLQAFFTATSAICVTGLTVVDTATHWSPLGEIVLLVLVQLGGIGIMTFASVVALAVNRRLGMGARDLATVERSTGSPGDVLPLLLSVIQISFAFQLTGAVLLGAGFWVRLDLGVGDAAWQGVFHSVMAFNNGGFSLFPDSLAGFVGDWWTNLVIVVLVFCGSVGFPVLVEVRRKLVAPSGRRPPFTLHTRLTLGAMVALLGVGFVGVLVLEWANTGTLGTLGVPEKVMASLFHSTNTRSGGFSTLDVGAMDSTTWLLTSILMFIGGGSAGTSGGIRVGTFAVIALMIWSEVRGDADVRAHRRRLPERAQRRAVAIAAVSMGVVVSGGAAVKSLAGIDLDRSLFEVTSAFGTSGLSTGITSTLPPGAQLVLIALMYMGRLGPLTFGAALVLRERHLRYRYPEEQPIIG